MKKLTGRLIICFVLLFTVLLILIFYFSSKTDPLQNQRDSLCLPEAKWGTSIDDTLAAFDTTREELGDNFVLSGNYGSGHAVLKDCTVFGEKSSDMLLLFYQTEDKAGSLVYVSIHYPKDADMDKVLAEMKSTYGQPTESLEVSPEFFSISQNTYNTDSTDQYWSGRQIIGLVGDNEKDALRRYNNLPENSLEQLGIFLQNPVTVASWSTNYPNAAIETNAVAGEEKLSETPNVVILDARIMFDLESIVNLMK